jgi:hypothetical protein
VLHGEAAGRILTEDIAGAQRHLEGYNHRREESWQSRWVHAPGDEAKDEHPTLSASDQTADMFVER